MAWQLHHEGSGDDRTQILVDDQFRKFAPVAELPSLARFLVHCRLTPGAGYWHPDETAALNAVEDRLLKVCGTDKSKIVSATIWLNDIRHRDLMNEVWTAWNGGQNLPVRACVEAKLADQRMLVEIQVTAVK